MKKLVQAAFAGAALAALSSCVDSDNCPPTHYRNLFREYIGVTDSTVETKIDSAWQQLFYGDDDTQRVYYPAGEDMAYILAVDSDDVRSEGMSYGMMIAVQLDKKEEFDRLWKWTKANMYHAEGERAGYFAWQCRRDGSIIDPGSASDGEEWFVTALYFAAGRWGNGEGIFNYQAEADAILRAMLGKDEAGDNPSGTVNMFDPEAKQVRFVPLKHWAGVSDPSYHLPAFYELWAEWADTNNEFWSEAAKASREHFRKAAHPTTGLMPDYALFEGSPYQSYGHEHFVFDAHRTLANVALDWAWFGKDEWQKEQSKRVLGFLSAYRPTIPYSFTLDGKPLTDGTSTSITAMAAVAALATERNTGEPYVRDLWEAPIPDGKYRYYNGLLYILGLLQTGGQFRVYAPQGMINPLHE
ncbi:MAG: glycoside hydrolase [Opitutales bacterium]|nr:glycoside hydrolase [Opitutales bacterium]